MAFLLSGLWGGASILARSRAGRAGAGLGSAARYPDRIDAGKSTPGVSILSQQRTAIGEIVEWLLLAWTASQAEEWRDKIVYLPLR